MVKVVGCVVRMRMCNKILTGVTTLLLLASMGRAEVQVFARVDRNQAQVGEQIILTVTVVSQKPLSVQVPPTLRISGVSCSQVRGPATSEEMSISGGRLLRRSTAEYAYFLTAERAGEIEIPAIPVAVEGTQF
ncbi:MAG TPA: BatD family protein, partial [Candidatus Latescibacteria bacterium]|nr:BatD family protein [Candidatus Latescibacterota bacterium]